MLKWETDDIRIEGSVHGGCKVNFVVKDLEFNQTLMHKYSGDTYVVEIKKKKEKRSLDANAYYQMLVRDCAHELGIGEAEYHNRSLAEVGFLYKDKDGEPEFVLKKDNDWWLGQLQGEDHYKPLDATEDRKGKMYRWFVKLKPSREMDSREMAILIDYVIQDAQSLGIKVKGDAEVQHLIEDWENINGSKTNV